MSFNNLPQDDIQERMSDIEAQLINVTQALEQNNQCHDQGRNSAEIDISALFMSLLRDKFLIVGIVFLFISFSLIVALSLPNVYRAQALLAPSEESQGGGIARMAGQMGGLASLAGINFGAGATDNKVTLATEILKSQSFVSEFIEKYGLLPSLMAVERWSMRENQIIFDSDDYDSTINRWVRDVEFPRQPRPSDWEAHKAFMKILSIVPDKETGFVRLSVDHQSPYIAAEWVSLLIREINFVIKEKDKAEAKKSIEFLQSQLAAVSLADMRTVFYQLIEEQTKTIMLAEVRDEYVFKVVDPPVVPEEKFGPNRMLICVAGLFLGLMLAFLVVLFRHILRRSS